MQRERERGIDIDKLARYDSCVVQAESVVAVVVFVAVVVVAVVVD